MSQMRPDQTIDVASTVENVEDFIDAGLADRLIADIEASGKFRDYSETSTDTHKSQAATIRNQNPAVAWWGLEWTFLYPRPGADAQEGENYLIRTNDSAPLPGALDELRRRVEARWPMASTQIQVNRYGDGEGLVWHSDVDSRGFTVNRTVTVALGAPRDVAYSRFPDDWKDRDVIGASPEGFAADHVVRSTDRSATMLTVEGQRAVMHAVIPGPGLRYGITFRQMRMW